MEHSTKDGNVDEDIYTEMESYWASRMKDRKRWKTAVTAVVKLKRLSSAPMDDVDAPDAGLFLQFYTISLSNSMAAFYGRFSTVVIH